jgi:serine/threonine-protein kinase RsbT
MPQRPEKARTHQVTSETLPIREEKDLLLVRQVVRKWADELGFAVLNQTKVVTAASELARNTLIHGGGGTVRLETSVDRERRGLRLTFEDQGPGIADIAQALTDGFTTSHGLGLGFGGARRLVNEFEVDSRPGEGTRVVVTQWA